MENHIGTAIDPLTQPLQTKKADGSAENFSVSADNVDTSGTFDKLEESVSNTYDGFNRLTKMTTVKAGKKTTVEYSYNGDDLRFKKVVARTDNGYSPEITLFTYDRQHVVLETDGGEAVKARYVRGINSIGRIDADNHVSFFCYNGHGDVVQTIDAGGKIENQYDFDIFGNPTLTVEGYSCPIRYAGEYYDSETGEYYLRARYYDSYTGRFTTEDTYEDPNNANQYVYCANDPIQNIDPTGHTLMYNTATNKVVNVTSAVPSSIYQSLASRTNAVGVTNASAAAPSPVAASQGFSSTAAYNSYWQSQGTSSGTSAAQQNFSSSSSSGGTGTTQLATSAKTVAPPPPPPDSTPKKNPPVLEKTEENAVNKSPTVGSSTREPLMAANVVAGDSAKSENTDTDGTYWRFGLGYDDIQYFVLSQDAYVNGGNASQKFINHTMVLQKMLRALGYYSDAIDGKFGNNTRNAVVVFQRDMYNTGTYASWLTEKGIDGIVGSGTWAILGLPEPDSDRYNYILSNWHPDYNSLSIKSNWISDSGLRQYAAFKSTGQGLPEETGTGNPVFPNTTLQGAQDSNLFMSFAWGAHDALDSDIDGQLDAEATYVKTIKDFEKNPSIETAYKVFEAFQSKNPANRTLEGAIEFATHIDTADQRFKMLVVNGDASTRAYWAGGVTYKLALARNLGTLGGESTASTIKLLQTERDTAFFWTGRTDGIGGAERALEIAKQKGGITLEGLIESRGIKIPEWDINDPDSIKTWEDVSAIYASQVSGEVRAVVGAKLREGNIWENIELPRLMNNPNVTKITTIDPKTLIETEIFRR